MSIHEVPVHDVKTSVWCAMIATKISVSIFSVRPKFYTDRLQIFWKHFLTYPIMTELARFSQNIANANTENNSVCLGSVSSPLCVSII